MHTTEPDLTEHAPASTRAAGSHLTLRGVRVERGGRTILRDVDLDVAPGELVGVVGASGAGKSTLLEVMAGLRPPTTGTARIDGIDATARRELVGYVPQDDLIHLDLPVLHTLRHAARLRTSHDVPAEVVARTITRTLDALELADRAGTTVRDLSGGERKRTSIAVELLTRPPALFLDEPTSGLDPATADRLMTTLRRLADRGTTVVLTSHRPDDLRTCDRVVTVAESAVSMSGPAIGVASAMAPSPRPGRAARAGAVRQWSTMVRRDVDLLRHQRLTAAIMLGAPALVVAMFVLLFRRGTMAPGTLDAGAAIGTTYWMAFAAFFFGLTSGLLQICTERTVVRREVFVGVRTTSYVAAKVTLLAPVLLTVDAAMLGVLRLLDRLPPLDPDATIRLLATLALTSTAALALGLLASAAVSEAAQATLALPMLCFPAVLFAGAVVPVASMGPGGRAISVLVTARWSFEALGHELSLPSRLAADPAGRALLERHADAFTHGPAMPWAVLVTSTLACLVATDVLLRRRA